MYIMGIQMILLLVLIAHTGTDNNNGSGCIPCLSYSDYNMSTTYNDSDCCPDETQAMSEAKLSPMPDSKSSECIVCIPSSSDSNSSTTNNNSNCCPVQIVDSGCCQEEIHGVFLAKILMPDLKRSDCILCPPRYSDSSTTNNSTDYDCCPDDVEPVFVINKVLMPNFVNSDCFPHPCYYDHISPTTKNNSDCCLGETGTMSEAPMSNLKNSDCIPCPPSYSNSSTTYNSTDSKILQGLSKMWISAKSADFLKGVIVTRLMPSFYIFVILISLPLNALALVTFTCRIKAKKPAVIYMSHLACVDLFFTLLLPLKVHYHLNASDWVFGEVACRVLSAAYYCYMYCSILLMMCISVDRLLAVALPITSQTWRSTRKATCVCVLVWLLALAGTVPLLSMRQTLKVEDVGVTCHDVLPENDPSRLYYVYLFSILSCLYFFLPLVVTSVSYCTIIYVLSTKSEHLASSSSPSGVRRKAVIMAITVLIEFVLCFAATNGLLLYHSVRLATIRDIGEGDSSYVAYLLAVCLGSTSVFLDPLLYYYGSSQSRQQMRSVFWCRKAKKVKTVNI